VFDIEVGAAVARVRERNPLVHAFITTRLEEALADAHALANERPRSSLHGVPYSLKDEWETKGLATTSGSARYRARISTESSDATGLAIPFGRFSNGLPRSIQLLGPPGSELLLLQVATDARLAHH
jgi:Asp-tRNA(Asn)/Glu-tRNA(Gln) amidotransferase A subunit family amidase